MFPRGPRGVNATDVAAGTGAMPVRGAIAAAEAGSGRPAHRELRLVPKTRNPGGSSRVDSNRRFNCRPAAANPRAARLAEARVGAMCRSRRRRRQKVGVAPLNRSDNRAWETARPQHKAIACGAEPSETHQA